MHSVEYRAIKSQNSVKKKSKIAKEYAKRKEILLTQPALPYDYTCFAYGTPFVFVNKMSTACKACITCTNKLQIHFIW